MEESKKVFLTGTIIIVLLVGALLIYFLVISPARNRRCEQHCSGSEPTASS